MRKCLTTTGLLPEELASVFGGGSVEAPEGAVAAVAASVATPETVEDPGKNPFVTEFGGNERRDSVSA